MPTCHQFQFSTCPISKRTETSPIFTAALRQPRETLCPTGHSLFRTCKVPKSFDQANGAQMTLSSKLLSVTAKGMYAFWTINTMPPCPHAINSNSQHVQSASERKHLQSSLLHSDSQGKHCHPTGHSLFRTCKVPKSFHQADGTHTVWLYDSIVKITHPG